MEAKLANALYVIGLHYPKEAAAINELLSTNRGQRLLAYEKMNGILEKLRLPLVLWEEEPEELDEPVVRNIVPDRYEMKEGRPLTAYFDRWGIEQIVPTGKEHGNYAARLLGGKVQWQLEIFREFRYLRIALISRGDVMYTRALTGDEGIWRE